MKKILLLLMFECVCQKVLAQDGQDSVWQVTLPEFTFTENLIKHNSKSDVYIITRDLRTGVIDAFDIINALPGVEYDNFKSKVSVRNDDRVLVKVNGQERDFDYIRAIDPKRVKEVEIVHTLQGRYVIAGYKYVIDIKLKNDYTGNDLSINNFTMFSPGNNGNDNLANEQPNVQYSHTDRKWNFNARYGYAYIKWNYPISYHKTYSGLSDFYSKEYTADSPNDHNRNRTHSANMGFDWKFSNRQPLSLRTQYTQDNSRHTTLYDNIGVSSDNLYSEFNEATGNDAVNNDFKASLIYNLVFSKKWSFYADLSYNFYKMNNDNHYSKNNVELGNLSSTQMKNYYTGTVDAVYIPNDKGSVNFGYAGTWALYRFTQNMPQNVLPTAKSDENRQNIFSYIDYAFNSQLSARVGLSFVSIHIGDGNTSKTYIECLPVAALNYIASQNLLINADYSTSMEYSRLYQLSPISYSLDERMIFQGNPVLKPNLRQELNLQAVLWQNLVLAGMYQCFNHRVSEFYSHKNDVYKYSFLNSKHSALAFLMMYEWKINKFISWENSFQFSCERISWGKYSNHANNIKFNSRLSCYIDPLNMRHTASYSRGMYKVPLLQGYEQNGQDLWQISLYKAFCNDMITVSFTYVPPIRFGMRSDQRRAIDAGFYKENQRLNLETYDNLLLLRVGFRLQKGIRSKVNNKSKFDDENKKRQRVTLTQIV